MQFLFFVLNQVSECSLTKVGDFIQICKFSKKSLKFEENYLAQRCLTVLQKGIFLRELVNSSFKSHRLECFLASRLVILSLGKTNRKNKRSLFI